MKFCLDSNVFIEAWKGYYSLEFFPAYWEKLDQLACDETVFATKEVEKEIIRIDDDLKKWLSDKKYFFREIDGIVQECLLKIYQKDEKHRRLVDSTKQRSVADPWVIAHAMAENAIVVTKEIYEHNPTKRMKIPNVCEAMGIEWINDFDFIRALGLKFTIL
ncbi:DUF4411 family protein [Planctomycetota bacterium]